MLERGLPGVEILAVTSKSSMVVEIGEEIQLAAVVGGVGIETVPVELVEMSATIDERRKTRLVMFACPPEPPLVPKLRTVLDINPR